MIKLTIIALSLLTQSGKESFARKSSFSIFSLLRLSFLGEEDSIRMPGERNTFHAMKKLALRMNIFLNIIIGVLSEDMSGAHASSRA